MLRNGPKSDRCHLDDEPPNLSGIGLTCVSCNRPLDSKLKGCLNCLIHRRIEFKILLLVYLCLHDIAPQYLAEMLTTHAVTRSLRSTDKQLLVVPRSKLKRHGDRSFNVVVPVLWNSLPECMKSSSSVASFKRTLKTFLFRQEYGVIN